MVIISKNILTKARRIIYALCLLIPYSVQADPFFDTDWDAPAPVAAAAFDFGNHDIFADEIITTADELDLSLMTPVHLNPGARNLDVMSFDIAGVMLGQPFDVVFNQFRNRQSLYQLRARNAVVFSISRDWKHNLDYECRQRNIFAPRQLANCVNSLARARGLLYASELHLERPATGERIVVYFTSHATGNIVWRVVYTNNVDDLPGEHERFHAQRESRIATWWSAVLDKYGEPNSGTDRWISADNTFEPMMSAWFGRLELTDLGLNAYDAAENFQNARENFPALPYFF